MPPLALGLKDHRQITFVTLNGFCPLSIKPPSHHVLNRHDQAW